MTSPHLRASPLVQPSSPLCRIIAAAPLPISLLWVCPLQSSLNSAASEPVNRSLLLPQHLFSQPEESPGPDSGPQGLPCSHSASLSFPIRARHAPASGRLQVPGFPSLDHFLPQTLWGRIQCQLRTRAQPRTCLNLHSLSLSLLYFSPSTEYYLTHYRFTYELVYFPPPECKFHKGRKRFFVIVVVFLVTTVSQLLKQNRCPMNIC